jgi:hypothetical protein
VILFVENGQFGAAAGDQSVRPNRPFALVYTCTGVRKTAVTAGSAGLASVTVEKNPIQLNRMQKQVVDSTVERSTSSLPPLHFPGYFFVFTNCGTKFLYSSGLFIG